MDKHNPDHPCGGLPISQWHVTVWYCHHHQAYFASSGSFDDTGADELQHRSYQSVEFGPFDNSTDVQHWVQSQLPGVRKIATNNGFAKELGRKE